MNIEWRKIQRRYSWSYRSSLSATAKLWSRLSTWLCKMSRGSCLSRLSEPESHPCSSFVHLCDELGRRVRHRPNPPKHYRSCVTHLCTRGTTSHKHVSNDWLILCVGDVTPSLLQEVVTHATELRKLSYCMTISVCPWFALIMMLRNFVDIALFVMPIWI